MHSALYRGRSFAAFPLVVLGFSLGFSWMVLEYSTLSPRSLGLAVQALGGFLGLAVGMVGFSSRDAMRNVLGPMNLLVYSSRTLPVPEKKLLFDFVVKDLVYYTTLFLVPVALGPLLLGGPGMMEPSLFMFGWFLAGLLTTLVLTRSSLRLSPGRVLEYRDLDFLSPLAGKSFLDVSRSSGGLLKVLFSLGILTGFYWLAVLKFPVARKLLNNPLLSFSVMLGTLNLSIYNWLNRFDSLEKYIYLPVTGDSLLDAKKTSYLSVALPISVAIVLISYLFYPFNLALSLLSAMTSTVYTLLVASRLTGLDPNQRLFDSTVFLRFILANSIVIVPLLIFSIAYQPGFFPQYALTCLLVTVTSLHLLR